MASETPDRHVSARYSITSDNCRFSGILCTYVIKKELFGLRLKKEAVHRLYAMVKHREGDYHFMCFVNHESTEAEYIHNMESFSGAKQAKDIGNYKFVFMIKFKDGDIEPLRLMCASERERQQWIGEINDIIRDIVEENSALSKDSGFGSGSSASKENTGHQERDYSYVAPHCPSLTQHHTRHPQAELPVYSPKTNRRRDKRVPAKQSPQEIGRNVTDPHAVNYARSVERSDEDINNGGRSQTTAKHLSDKATQQQERPKPAPRPKARTHIGLPAPVKESQQETYCKSGEHTHASGAHDDGSITTLKLLRKKIPDDDTAQTTAKYLSNKATQQQERAKPAARRKAQRHRGLPVPVKESQQETYCKNSEHTHANVAYHDGSITTFSLSQIPDDDRAQTTAKHLSNKDTRQQERSKPAARPKAQRHRGLPVPVNESQEETHCNTAGIQAQADTAHDYDSITALKQRYSPADEDRLLSNLDRETVDGQESTYINLVRQRIQPTDDERSWLSCRGPQVETEDDAHAEHRQDKSENDSSE